MPPCFLQTGKEKIGATQEKNLWKRRVATSEGRDGMIDDGLEQRGDDLLDGHSGFQKRVGIGFGEDAALAAHFVECVSRIAHFREFFGRDLELARGLFNERARAA